MQSGENFGLNIKTEHFQKKKNYLTTEPRGHTEKKRGHSDIQCKADTITQTSLFLASAMTTH